MTTRLEWARHGHRLRATWIHTLHPGSGTKFRRVLDACDSHWRTSREVMHLTGLCGGTARPLLFAAARKGLLLRRRAPVDASYPKHNFQPRWQYRLIGT